MAKNKSNKHPFLDEEHIEIVKEGRKQRHQEIMKQEQKNKFEYADWLFNQFVDAERRDKQDWSLNYWNTLNRYAEIGLCSEAQKEERLYVFKLDIIIAEAMACWNTHLLIKRSEEAQQDYKERMEAYEHRLRAIGHDEATIKVMLEYKIRLNYGNN